MILSKTFDCTIEDIDSIVVALAKEIEDGYSISKFERHPFALQIGLKMNEPMFSIGLRRKDMYE